MKNQNYLIDKEKESLDQLEEYYDEIPLSSNRKIDFLKLFCINIVLVKNGEKEIEISNLMMEMIEEFLS